MNTAQQLIAKHTTGTFRSRSINEHALSAEASTIADKIEIDQVNNKVIMTFADESFIIFGINETPVAYAKQD